MKASDASKLFVFLGIAFSLLGIGLCMVVETRTYNVYGYSYEITYNPHIFTGSILLAVGVNWFIAGAIISFADTKISDEGIFLTLLFGLFGVVIWLILSKGESFLSFHSHNTERTHMHCPRCGMPISLTDSTQFCPYCGERLKQESKQNTNNSNESSYPQPYCPKCGNPLKLIQDRWYCDKCKTFPKILPVCPTTGTKEGKEAFWARLVFALLVLFVIFIIIEIML